jgi:hypothetical protein
MKLKKSDFVRWLLSIGLIYGVYTETGYFTTLFAFLSLIAFEILSFSERLKRKL